ELAQVGHPLDDVDLLAPQLVDDVAHPRPARAHASADRVDVVVVGDDRDLGAVARLAGHLLDLDRARDDLGYLELEQALDETGMRPKSLGVSSHSRSTSPVSSSISWA